MITKRGEWQLATVEPLHESVSEVQECLSNIITQINNHGELECDNFNKLIFETYAPLIAIKDDLETIFKDIIESGLRWEGDMDDKTT